MEKLLFRLITNGYITLFILCSFVLCSLVVACSESPEITRNPVLISAPAFQELPPAIQVAAGPSHTLGLLSNGTVWAWGASNKGQLGIDTEAKKCSNEEIQLCIQSMIKLPLTNVTKIAAGEYHSLALIDGNVWTWGTLPGDASVHLTPVPVEDNSDGSGLLSNVVAIAAGLNFSLALRSDGTVATWGENRFGQLGDGTTLSRSYQDIIYLTSPDDLSTKLSNISQITAGGLHAMAIQSVANSHQIISWGQNQFGQLGSGNTTNPLQPQYVVAVTGNGLLNNAQQISAGMQHSLVLTIDGTVLAWGSTEYRQLGNSVCLDNTQQAVPCTRPQPVSHFTQGSTVIRISSGSFHSAATRSDGVVFMWGRNTAGQIGNNHMSTFSEFSLQNSNNWQLFLGAQNSFAINSNECINLPFSAGTVWAWGDNQYLQLGLESVLLDSPPQQLIPRKVASIADVECER